MQEKKDPMNEAKTLLAHEAIAKYIKNQFDAFVTVGFTDIQALELAKASVTEIIRSQQKHAHEQLKSKGKTHGTDNI